MSKLYKSPKNIPILVSQLGQGDIVAFSEIYLLYYNRLLRYGNIIHPHSEVVGDVIQDLFVWILQNPKNIKLVNNFEVYIFQSLKKNLIGQIKRNRRSREILSQFLVNDSTDRCNYTIEERIIRNENNESFKKLIKRQLDRLPVAQKEVIYLRYYEGLTYDEIALVISKSNQVARNYASRAIKQLRKTCAMEKERSI